MTRAAKILSIGALAALAWGSAPVAFAGPAVELRPWIPCCGDICPGICFPKTSTYPNEPLILTVLAIDALGTIDTTYRGTVTLTSDDPLAVLPPPYEFTDADQGAHGFPVSLRSLGLRAFTVSDAAGLSGSFSLRVVAAAPVPDLGALARAMLAIALAASAVTVLTQRTNR